MDAVVKSMGVIGVIMMFLVATSVGEVHLNYIPCCHGNSTSCCNCKSGDIANVTTFANVFFDIANVTTFANVWLL